MSVGIIFHSFIILKIKELFPLEPLFLYTWIYLYTNYVYDRDRYRLAKFKNINSDI